MPIRPSAIAALLLGIGLLATRAGAAGLDKPAGQPILTISSAIAEANQGSAAVSDRAIFFWQVKELVVR